jgi:hypothetical protein
LEERGGKKFFFGPTKTPGIVAWLALILKRMPIFIPIMKLSTAELVSGHKEGYDEESLFEKVDIEHVKKLMQ